MEGEELLSVEFRVGLGTYAGIDRLDVDRNRDRRADNLLCIAFAGHDYLLRLRPCALTRDGWGWSARVRLSGMTCPH